MELYLVSCRRKKPATKRSFAQGEDFFPLAPRYSRPRIFFFFFSTSPPPVPAAAWGRWCPRWASCRGAAAGADSGFFKRWRRPRGGAPGRPPGGAAAPAPERAPLRLPADSGGGVGVALISPPPPRIVTFTNLRRVWQGSAPPAPPGLPLTLGFERGSELPVAWNPPPPGGCQGDRASNLLLLKCTRTPAL